MLEQLLSMAKVDDLLALKRAAEALKSPTGEKRDKDTVAKAIEAAAQAAEVVIEGMVPAGHGDADGRTQVSTQIFRELPSRIRHLRDEVEGPRHDTASPVLADSLMSIAGTAAYGIIRICLNGTDREDCKLR